MEVCMKRMTIFVTIAFLLAYAVYAQEAARTQRVNNPINVEGTLKLERGLIAIQSGDTVYYAPSLNRYAGFIDGLREGNTVSVEGYANRNTILPTKITVSGRSYDLFAGPPVRNQEMQSSARPTRENRENAESRDARPRREIAPGQGNVQPNRENFGPGRGRVEPRGKSWQGMNFGRHFAPPPRRAPAGRCCR
jgi:hypothetical protein